MLAASSHSRNGNVAQKIRQRDKVGGYLALLLRFRLSGGVPTLHVYGSVLRLWRRMTSPW